MKEEDVKRFFERLKEERVEIYKKVSFYNEHKLHREAAYFSEKAEVITSIVDAMSDSLINERKPVDNVNFNLLA